MLTDAQIDRVTTYLRAPMPLELACELACVRLDAVQTLIEAAFEAPTTEDGRQGLKIQEARAEAATELIASIQNKGRKDWKSSAHLLNAAAPVFQQKTGVKELGEGLKSLAAAVFELPARRDEHGLLTIIPEDPAKGEE
jgi:hypothetical protein